jgi:hypothetical protein
LQKELGLPQVANVWQQIDIRYMINKLGVPSVVRIDLTPEKVGFFRNLRVSEEVKSSA